VLYAPLHAPTPLGIKNMHNLPNKRLTGLGDLQNLENKRDNSQNTQNIGVTFLWSFREKTQAWSGWILSLP
jgi:hypothetical protein